LAIHEFELRLFGHHAFGCSWSCQDLLNMFCLHERRLHGSRQQMLSAQANVDKVSESGVMGSLALLRLSDEGH
jgi:hypothetical protein